MSEHDPAFKLIFRPQGLMGKEFHIDQRLNRVIYECCGPLPRSREIEPYSTVIAAKQISKRETVARNLGQIFAQAVMDILAKQDTVNGYDQELEYVPGETASTVQIAEDGTCTCNCATRCPLGKTGMALRCTEEELNRAGIKTVRKI